MKPPRRKTAMLEQSATVFDDDSTTLLLSHGSEPSVPPPLYVRARNGEPAPCLAMGWNP